MLSPPIWKLDPRGWAKSGCLRFPPPAYFLLNDVVTKLPEIDGSINVNMTGTEFTFAYGGDEKLRPDQFYLASLTACTPDRVPEGGATIALLGLALTSLGALRKRLVK